MSVEVRNPRTRSTRCLPIGAEVTSAGVHFRVWAPAAHQVTLVLEGGENPLEVALTREADGYFSGVTRVATAGSRYRYRLDDDAHPYPDPASRFQPEGPFGPSLVVDPEAFPWSDTSWRGTSISGQAIYEMHVGTFTPEGTWRAATEALPGLADLGVTLLEVMPVAEFPGRFGWGYDGVALFAPTRLYGPPDDMRAFVDHAHGLGLGVILDVVYNHVGPDGNHFSRFAPSYFTDRYECEWGQPLNFDGPDSGPVREFFLANARYWIEEFHLDGLRLDATQQIFDASPEHILTAIVRSVREAAGDRSVVVIGENEPQRARLARPKKRGGAGFDALWNDDFHHTARVALTGRAEGYYSDHGGTPQELVSAVKWGYLFQGQWYGWQKKRRGTPALDLAPPAFINFLDNHDQIANSGRGDRIHALTSPGRFRAMTALLLLAPGTPMLFMGQEHAAPSPFLYFADHKRELATAVRRGRAEFLSQFPSVAAELREHLPDPSDPATFTRCKLDPRARTSDNAAFRLHRDLLWLRRSDPAFNAQRPRNVDGAVLGPEAFVLRFFASEGDRLLVINLGRDQSSIAGAEPLLAPPEDHRWVTLWSSEDRRYGGAGTPPVEGETGWRLPGHAAVVLQPQESPWGTPPGLA